MAAHHRSAGIDKRTLSRRGVMVARRFPKAKVASSILVGGIPVSYATFGGHWRCIWRLWEESFLDILSAREFGKVRYRYVLLEPRPRFADCVTRLSVMVLVRRRSPPDPDSR